MMSIKSTTILLFYDNDCIETRLRDYELDPYSNGFNEAAFILNWRDLDIMHPDLIRGNCFIETDTEISHVNLRDMSIKNDIVIMRYNEKFENYVYTSTKYLREIKESGIECLVR